VGGEKKTPKEKGEGRESAGYQIVDWGEWNRDDRTRADLLVRKNQSNGLKEGKKKGVGWRGSRNLWEQTKKKKKCVPT